MQHCVARRSEVDTFRVNISITRWGLLQGSGNLVAYWSRPEHMYNYYLLYDYRGRRIYRRLNSVALAA